MAQRLPDQSQPGSGSADPYQPVVGRGGDGGDGEDDACASPRRRVDALRDHVHDDRDVRADDAVLPLLVYSHLWISYTVQVAVNSQCCILHKHHHNKYVLWPPPHVGGSGWCREETDGK